MLGEADQRVRQRVADVPEGVGRRARHGEGDHEQTAAGAQQVAGVGESGLEVHVVQGGDHRQRVVEAARMLGAQQRGVLGEAAAPDRDAGEVPAPLGGGERHARVRVDAVHPRAGRCEGAHEVAAPAADVEHARSPRRQRAQDPAVEVRVVVPGVAGVQRVQASARPADDGVRRGADVHHGSPPLRPAGPAGVRGSAARARRPSRPRRPAVPRGRAAARAAAGPPPAAVRSRSRPARRA